MIAPESSWPCWRPSWVPETDTRPRSAPGCARCSEPDWLSPAFMRPFSISIDGDDVTFQDIQLFPIGMRVRFRRPTSRVNAQKLRAHTGFFGHIQAIVEELHMDPWIVQPGGEAAGCIHVMEVAINIAGTLDQATLSSPFNT
jgi:hypothetical protein